MDTGIPGGNAPVSWSKKPDLSVKPGRSRNPNPDKKLNFKGQQACKGRRHINFMKEHSHFSKGNERTLSFSESF
jgi:hypothetical protein